MVYGREEVLIFIIIIIAFIIIFKVVHGAIALQPLRRQLPGFNDYFNQLTEKYFNDSDPINPWYEEYYRTYCNCSQKEDEVELKLCPFSSKARPKKLQQVKNQSWAIDKV